MGSFLRAFVFGVSLFVAASVAAPSMLAAKEETFTVEFDDYDRLVVEITLPGGDTRLFLFDSAARRSLLLMEDASGAGIMRLSTGTMRHYSGFGLMQLPVARIDGWQVGERQFKSTTVGLFPHDPSCEGLLGHDIFAGHILHWNPAVDELKTYTNLSALSGEGWHNVGGRANRNVSVVVKTRYRGIDISVLIATGSSHSFIDITVAKKLFPKAPAFTGRRQKEYYTAQGLMFVDKRYPSLTLPAFNIGDWDIGDIKILAKKINAQEITGRPGTAVMILGADILLQQELAFDFRDYQLWVKD